MQRGNIEGEGQEADDRIGGNPHGYVGEVRPYVVDTKFQQHNDDCDFGITSIFGAILAISLQIMDVCAFSLSLSLSLSAQREC